VPRNPSITLFCVSRNLAMTSWNRIITAAAPSGPGALELATGGTAAGE
jgi:hypothetical protein